MYKIPANTLFIGQNLVFVPECHSTNTLALQLCQQPSTPEGTLVITNNQTAGRGQRGNSWEAAPGTNFTFSLVLKPAFLLLRDQFFLNIVIALAVHDYLLTKKIADVRIKWPNDIMIAGKKVCGILIENQVQGNRFSNSIAGIGININQEQFGISTATSLYRVTGNRYTLADELEILLQKTEARYIQLRQNQQAKLREDYLNVLYWRGEQHLFEAQEQSFSGTITGLDDSGKLQVQHADGAVQVYDLKEIRYIQ
ncbi:MAG TPA: biotin--[acetyl-CoA-carboxylase] ligase [Ohtaekwangia sp.]|uniref:biotin--[acetyl-CoA-carboxylase] ligase n=1 Tax=Ohtaekwangia sp. TaxID=2066019 RepID=UPI002F949748